MHSSGSLVAIAIHERKQKMTFTIDEATRRDILKLSELALVEDIGSSDLEAAVDCTTLAVVPDNVPATATLVAREQGVVCGLKLVELIVSRFSPQLQVVQNVSDGDLIAPQKAIAQLKGETRQILMMERTCLNFLCRLSGISTQTRKFVDLVSGTHAQILDTRKTTPGWRRIEKYAVACGGGANHRMGLYDAVMIKDNHLAMYGNHIDNHQLSVSQAIELAQKWVTENAARLPHGEQTVIQVEVDRIDQLENALPANPDIVLLDNMNTEQLEQCVKIRDAENPQVLLEASGGVNLGTVAAIAATGVERISIGALTHSATNFDIGLDWKLH